VSGALTLRVALTIDAFAPSPAPNWANISHAGFASGTNADQSIAGIPVGSILVRVNVVTALYSVFNAVKNGGASTVDILSTPTFTMNNGETWHFSATYNGSDPVINSLVAVINESNGKTLDTFTVSLD
jgi:hypothetical protein